MRFKDIPFMKRVFDLAGNRNLPVTLIPYIMQMVEPAPNTFLFFNNARIYSQDTSVIGDPFNVSSYVNDASLTTPDEVSRRVATLIQPFRDLFRAEPGHQPDIEAGMKALFAATDKFSLRSYMIDVLGMNAKDVSWCETLDMFTGWYDRALTDSTCLDTFHRLMVITWVPQSFLRVWLSIGPQRPSLGLSH